MKITSDLTNLTTAILILTVQMFIEWTRKLKNPDFRFFKFFLDSVIMHLLSLLVGISQYLCLHFPI
jgi:hypothetical protein